MGGYTTFYKFPQRTRVRNALFVFAIILLGFFSWFSYYRIKKMINSSEMVNHSNLVILKIEEVLSIVKDAETGQRGFLITGDSAFFQPAIGVNNRASSIMAEIQALVKNDKKQAENLNLFRSLVDARLDQLRVSREYRFSENYVPATLRSHLLDGKRSMDSVRAHARMMITEEKSLLTDRIKTNHQYTGSTPLYSLIITIVLLNVLIIAFYVLDRKYQQEQQMKEKITESEQNFKGLLESAPDAMIIADGNGAISLVNEQTEKLFGYKRGELINQPVEILMPVQFQLRHVEHRRNYFQHPAIRQMGEGMELFARAKNGKEFPVEISLSHLQTKNGLIVLAAIRDVSEKKKAQQAMIESEKLSTVADISRSIAHEIRNPLTNISLSVGILREKLSHSKDFDQLQGSIDMIAKNYQRIDNLVKDLLYSHRAEKRNLKAVDISRIVEEVLPFAADRIVLKGIELRKNFEKHSIIMADSETLKIALLDIIVNAVEAMSPGIGILTISIQKNEEMIKLTIEDNGIGMSKEVLDKIFEPYYTSKPLANVRTILQNHNVKSEVTSEPGKGTKFEIFFAATDLNGELAASNALKENGTSQYQ
jgi:PAS domain S-box-containing protein